MTDVLGDGFELRNELVVLRDFEPGDRSAFVEWAADEPTYAYMAWRLDGPAAAAAEFERVLSHPEHRNPTRRHWYLAVTTSAGGFCGTTGFEHRLDGLGELRLVPLVTPLGSGLRDGRDLPLARLRVPLGGRLRDHRNL